MERRRPSGKLLAIIAAIVAAIAVAAVLVVALTGGKKPSNPAGRTNVAVQQSSAPTATTPTASSAGTEPSSTPTATPTHPTPAEPRLPSTQSHINFAHVANAPHLAQVAKLLDTYFTGINEHDGQKAASVFATNGSVNPSDPTQVAHFAEGIRTTHDDQISVASVKPATFDGQSGLAVRMHFRSRQAASLGPNNETCSDWTLTQKLVAAGNGYLLLGSEDIVHPAC